VVRNFYALRRNGVEHGGKAALHVRRLRGRPHEKDIFAEIGTALAAWLATAAPARRIDGDPVAGLQARRGPSDLDHLARDLMTEHQRRRHDKISGAGMAIIMHVGPANAAGAETDSHHAGCERIKWPLNHAQIFRAEQCCGEGHRCHFASPIYFGNQSVRSGM
jgi:hypothetical protein